MSFKLQGTSTHSFLLPQLRTITIGEILLGCALAYIGLLSVWRPMYGRLGASKYLFYAFPSIQTILGPYSTSYLERPGSASVRLDFHPRFVQFSRRGWLFAERAEVYVELGPVWALVSPTAITYALQIPMSSAKSQPNATGKSGRSDPKGNASCVQLDLSSASATCSAYKKRHKAR